MRKRESGREKHKGTEGGRDREIRSNNHQRTRWEREKLRQHVKETEVVRESESKQLRE